MVGTAVGSAASSEGPGSGDETMSSICVGSISISDFIGVLHALKNTVNVIIANRRIENFIAASYHEALENCRMKYNQGYYLFGG